LERESSCGPAKEACPELDDDEGSPKFTLDGGCGKGRGS
jgi:hypothetical protein